jgi:hypothetical protein
MIREGSIEETKFFGDLEEDGKKMLEVDLLEISATFTDVATPEVIMENSEVADVISKRKEVDAPDCQGMLNFLSCFLLNAFSSFGS